MTPHDTFLRLAATAVDEHLGSPDRARLEQHVAGCPSCARAVAGYRADAAALAALPPVILSERRGAEILASVLASPSRGMSPVRLVLVAALLALALLGSLWAGSELLRRWNDEDLALVLPVPSATASPSGAPPATPDANAEYPGYNLVVTQSVAGDDGSSVDWVTLLDPSSGALTPLAPGRDPAWLSADRIVYTCGEPAGAASVCAIDIDAPGSPQTLLTEAGRPVPAPDGSAIAVNRGPVDTGETWIMAPDGSRPRRLTGGDFDRWSPDGAWLAGQPETSGALEVAIIGADGEGLRVIGSGYDPAWSPTGDRIAYTAVDGDTATIHVVDVATGDDSVQYTAAPGIELAGPAWLADGALAFIRGGDLQILEPGAGDPAAITSGTDILGPTIGERLTPSPDGEWIAFTQGPEASPRVGIESPRANRGISFPDTGITQPRWAPTPRPQPGEPGTPPLLGSTWEPATMPVPSGAPTGRVEAVIAGGIGFLAVGRGCLTDGDTPVCEGIVWRSVDGRAWERVETSDALDTGAYFSTSGPEIGMFDVEIGGPGFVAIGYAARPNLEATAWFSGDGLAWERIPLGDAGSTRVNAVGWDGQQFVLVGGDRSDWDGTLEGMATATARAAVWTSGDGRTWTRVPHAPIFDVGGFLDTMEDPSTGGMNDLVSGLGGLVVVGSDCTSDGSCTPAAWGTFGSDTWGRVADMEGVTGVLRSVAVTDAGYVAVGTGEAAVMHSPDGQTWRSQRAPVGDLDTVTRIGDRFFATASSGPETVWASEDGVVWTPLEADGGPTLVAGEEGAEWRFGADDLTAVWFGLTENSDPAAWVSNPPATP
jgi:anti-sigma factor RsiW